MSFSWEIPNPPLNEAALARMRQHFPKPAELMPEAWFMNGEVNYFSWLAETPPDELEPRLLEDAMNEIAGGIIAFPLAYVDTWKAWFKYLLPYAIASADKDSGSTICVLCSTLTAFMTVYPIEIYEEYEGFRDDVICTLGTRIFSDISSLEELDFSAVSTLLWRLSPDEQPNIHDEIRLPMLFGLKYFESSKIEDWVKSIIGIKNYAWHFALIIWWLSYNKFLGLAGNWPQDSRIEPLLKIENGLVDAFWVTQMEYESLDAFIPQTNRIIFEKELAQQLSIGVFQTRVADIKSHHTFIYDNKVIPIPKSVHDIIQELIKEFEQHFFGQ